MPLPFVHRGFAAAVLALWLCSSTAWALGGFSIQLVPGPGLQSNPDALAAFERAAGEWENAISSPVTVYVNVDLSTTDSSGHTFGSSTIGSTSFTSYDNNGNDINRPYALVRDAMAARSTRPGDAVLAALPTSAQVTALLPDGATLDNTTLGILRANQRALGLLSNTDIRADGSITFNSAFTFDYNRFDSDGVASNKIDFQTAAAHEIGHLLGFVSDVDDFDGSPGLSSDNLTTLDLFRFPTTHAPASTADFQLFQRVLKPGVESVLTDTDVHFALSTGASQGDGNQAGHWKDDMLFQNGVLTIMSTIGIMDPTLGYGVYEDVGPADLRAMELIGYDVVPEPGSAVLLLLGGAWLGLLRRARQSYPSVRLRPGVLQSPGAFGLSPGAEP